jgi:molybdate transport system regulatory protein
MKGHQKQGDRLTGSRTQTSRKAMPRLTIRIDFDAGRAVGPGKIRLLEMIDMHGSISEAGRQMGISYRRAWLLVDSLNRCFRDPVVASRAGGEHGGGASLTEFGHALVHHYRAVESAAAQAGGAHIEALSAVLGKQTTAAGETTAGRPRRLALSLD